MKDPKFDPTRCKERVSHGWHYYQCSRRPKFGEYCKQHHPDTIAEKSKKATEKYNKEVAERRLQHLGPSAVKAIQEAYEDLLGNRPREAEAKLRIWLKEKYHG